MDIIILVTGNFLWDYVKKDSFILSGMHPAAHQWVKDLATVLRT